MEDLRFSRINLVRLHPMKLGQIAPEEMMAVAVPRARTLRGIQNIARDEKRACGAEAEQKKEACARKAGAERGGKLIRQLEQNVADQIESDKAEENAGSHDAGHREEYVERGHGRTFRV